MTPDRDLASHRQRKREQDAPASAGELYAERRARFDVHFARANRRWNRISNLRLVVAFAALGAAGWAAQQSSARGGALAAVLASTFIALIVLHRSTGAERRRLALMAGINHEAEQRWRRAWDVLPLRHGVPAEGHSFAADLDLFGRASLFHLLDTTSTPMGASRLRRWLLTPSAPDGVQERQKAVAELAPLLDWRQELQRIGRSAHADEDRLASFLSWCESDRWLERRRWMVWLARASAVGVLGTGALDLGGLMGTPLWIAFLLMNAGLLITTNREVGRRLAMVASHHGALLGYSAMLEHIGRGTVHAPRLAPLGDRLAAHDDGASHAIKRLHRWSAWVIPRGSMPHLPLQLLVNWDIQILARLEGWHRRHGSEVRGWLDAIGEIEAIASLASLAHDHPDWTFPVIDHNAQAIEAEHLGHSLLPNESRVCNDVTVGPPGTFLLVTGSNMSGKSTLLRAIGVNVVLAGAGGPVCARVMRMPPVRVWTSVRVQDSLEHGVSRYMAELLRLKDIVDAARGAAAGEPKVLYLLDEILQGTNTAERQIAARRVISFLVQCGAIGAVTTHDLTLVDSPELRDRARCVHFSEQFRTGPDGMRMEFDYRLRSGLATSTNALRLLEMVGLDLTPVEHAPHSDRPGHGHWCENR